MKIDSERRGARALGIAAWASVPTLFCSATLSGRALAQDQAAGEPDAAAERSQAFRAVEGAVQEDVPGGPLLVAAYTVVLTALVLYVIRLTRLQQRVGADLQRLTSALQRGSDEAGDG